MTARIIDGKARALRLTSEVAAGVAARVAAGKPPPGLAVVLVGDNPASHVYVRNKRRMTDTSGMRSFAHDLPATTSQADLLALIDALNVDPAVNGILVQLPLPPQIDADLVTERIDPLKDVDGFHPYNIGRLVLKRPTLRPCTPYGCMTLLKDTGEDLIGKHAVVIGQSNIVGRPMALELLMERCTVTICHSKTRDLPGTCRRGDILVCAMGRAGMITKDYVKPGATVVDVGMNKITDRAEFEKFFKGNEKREAAFAKNGSTLIGDVHPNAAEVAGKITPVPGGVGPLTIAMLMVNTVTAAKMRRGGKLKASA